MKKKFLTNISLLLLVNLLVKPFWILGIDRTVQNAVGTEQYGFYFSLFNLSLLLNMLLDIGITGMNHRNVARAPGTVRYSVPNMLMVKGSLALVYAVVVLVAGLIIGYGAGEFRILYWLIANQFLASAILFLRSNVSGLQFFTLDSLLSVLDRFLMIIICGLLLWGGFNSQPFRIEWFVYAQTAAYSLTALTVFFIVLRKAGRFVFQWKKKLLRSTIRSSFPYALMTLLMASYTRIDSVMLERMLPDGDYQAGLYAQAFRLLDAASMVGFLFAGMLLPMFSKMLKQNNPVLELLRMSAIMLLVPAIITVACSCFYSNQIMQLLYTDATPASSLIFSILMTGFIPVCLVYIFSTLLTANGNLREINTAAAIGVLVNVVLNTLLIPKFEAAGSAAASVVTQSLVALMYIFWVFRIFRFSTDRILMLRGMVFVLLLLAAALILTSVDIPWWLGVGLLAASGFGSSLIVRLFRLKSFIDIIASGE